MFLLLISWILLFFVFLSFGEFFIRITDKLIRINVISNYNFLEKFWVGVFFLTLFSILINFVIPLDKFVLGGYLIVALILNVYFKMPQCIYRDVRLFCNTNRNLVFCFLLISIIVIFYSLYPNYIYDNGLYHTQTMKWYQQYVIVPGLGNLNSRLAFNSSALLIYELFNYQLGIFNTFTSISGLCFLVFSAWCFKRIAELRFASSLYLVFLQLVFLLSFGAMLASYNTDLLPALLVITLIMVFIFDNKKWDKPIFFLCLPLLCVTFKLSTYPICLLCFVSLVYYIKHKRNRELIVCIVCGSLLILPWIVRFIIETGYLIYPFPAIDIFSFDWKMPLEKVIDEKDSVVAFTRMPGFNVAKVAAMPLKEWIFIWYFKLSNFNSLFILLALFSPLFVPFIYRKTSFNNAVLIGWLIVMIGLVFSFTTAPSTRFHYGFVILASTLPFLFYQDSNYFTKNGYFKTIYFISFLFIVSVFVWILLISLNSLIKDHVVPQSLFDVIDVGFLETRQGLELFYARYYSKSIAFAGAIILLVCVLVGYRNEKIKSLFSRILNLIVTKKNQILMTAIFLVMVVSGSNLIHNFCSDNESNFISLLVIPKEPDMDKPEMQKYLLSPDQVAFYPINSDRCVDCDLPCSNNFNPNLEMRGSDIRNGFRVKK